MNFHQLMLSTATALVTTVGISTMAQAITIRHDKIRWDGYYQNLGNAYPSVGQIFNNLEPHCSGTLITSQWVLTAGHCTDNLNPYYRHFNIGQFSYGITQSIPHPDWSGERTWEAFFEGSDIGLIQLNGHVSNVNPSPLFTGFNEVGKVGTYVGFGSTGTGSTGSLDYNGEPRYDGRKRGAYNTVDALGSSFDNNWSSNLLLADFDHPWGISNQLGHSWAWNLEGSTARGDSGGGLFIDGKLAGVTSFGRDQYGWVDSRYGTIMASTRVSSFRDWINSVINGQTFASSNSSGSSSSFNYIGFSSQDVSATSVPESSPLVGLGVISMMGLFGLVNRRRKKSNS